MLRLVEFAGPVILVLWIYCVVSVILTPDGATRNLPKLAWLFLVLLFPLVGSIAWLVAGRPDTAGSRRSSHEREAPAFPEYDRPGRAAGVTAESDEEFLRRVRERAEQQRRTEQERRRREAGDA
ncbi:hypothetical protein G7072_07310 [Nocardioides sp. HDW12B]|uniref:PLDc N-terminal domain-containing protein n=1 Tax=Nocardioides sp. HDW12B TaxID=2714939 RepID=UPI001407AD2C|nr:PLDc N-terminal domain-containing protein [Nocardioides sp. HDW12B]QIK66177.1 hypothetical protein G7072_07310 [Nocardioides sp. HDW12B]